MDNVINYLLKRRERLQAEYRHYNGTMAVLSFNMVKTELEEVNKILSELNVMTFDMLADN
jgi:hypothetical protein